MQKICTSALLFRTARVAETFGSGVELHNFDSESHLHGIATIMQKPCCRNSRLAAKARAAALAAVTIQTHLLSRSQRGLGPEAGSQTPNCYRQNVATGSGETR